MEALFSLTNTPLKIWRRRSSCRTLRTFGLTPLILENNTIMRYYYKITTCRFLTKKHCGFSKIWLITYKCVTIVDKSGKEHIINHTFQTFTWTALYNTFKATNKYNFKIVTSHCQTEPPSWQKSSNSQLNILVFNCFGKSNIFVSIITAAA